MPRGNKIQIRTGSAAPSAADFATSEPAWDSSAGKLYVKNAAGSMVEIGAGGAASLAAYATTAGFPATGSATVLYLDETSSKLYQWESPVYVEIGTAGGGFSHAASHAADGSDAIAISAAQVSGLPTAGAGSANYCAGNDARLSDSRSPTSHASSHASGGADALTLAASQIGSGTLEDARLSSAVALHTQINTTLGQAAGVIDAIPRTTSAAGVTAAAGQALIAFFTPVTTITVSQIAMSTGAGAVAAGLTLARMGIYTYTEGGTATLVARTASDTSLFNANNTTYTRSLDTTGGYPATYTLNAGTRYGVAYICVGTTQPQLVGRSVLTAVGVLSPRLSGGSSTGLSDLPTSLTPNQNSQAPFARLS